MQSSNLLFLMVLAPLLGAVSQVVRPTKVLSITGAIISFFSLLFFFFQGDWSVGKEVVFFRSEWIPHYQAEFYLRINGMNFFPLLSLMIVSLILLFSFWNKKAFSPALNGLILLTQSFLTIALLSGDVFVQVVFWGASVVPIYFLSALFGERDGRAAFHYLMHSMVGVFLVFIGMMIVYYFASPHSFNIEQIREGQFHQAAASALGVSAPEWAFVFVCLGFFLRLPLFPFTGWMAGLTESLSVEMLVVHLGMFLTSTVVIFSQLVTMIFREQLINYAMVFWVLGLFSTLTGALMMISRKSFSQILSALGMVFSGTAMIALGSGNSFSLLSVVLSSLSTGLSVAGMAWIYSCLERRNLSWEQTGWKSTGILFSIQSAVFGNMAFIPASSAFIPLALMMSGAFEKAPVIALIAVLTFLIMIYGVFRVHQEKILGSTGEPIGLDIREKSVGVFIVIALLLFGIWPRELVKISQPAIGELLKIKGQ